MKMKKNNLLILAVAALGFAACANDETTAVNEKLAESNAISFRANVNGLMRGADVNASTLQSTGFTVFANVASSGTNYFPETLFKWNSTTSTYNSDNKYYWPSSGSLDFFAYANSKPVGHAEQMTHEALTKAFTVTPDEDAQYQTDLIVAYTTNKSKTSAAVPINFRHTQCKVAIKLYNGNKDNLDISVRDASICYVKNSGVFTFSDTNTDGNNSDGTGTILTLSSWADVVSPATALTSYIQTDASTSAYNVAVGSAEQVGQDWILIPQTFTYKTTYESTGEKLFEGPCIKVNLKIQNHANSAYIVGAADNPSDDNDNEGYVTAMWPLKATPSAWAIGKKYTYTIDLAGGGYYPADQDGDTVLDPILDGAEIKFTVTVDTWNPEDGNVYVEGL